MEDDNTDYQYIEDLNVEDFQYVEDFDIDDNFIDDNDFCVMDAEEQKITGLTKNMTDVKERLDKFDNEQLENIMIIKRNFYILCDNHRYIIDDSLFLQKLENIINDKISYYEDKLFKLSEELIDKEIEKEINGQMTNITNRSGGEIGIADSGYYRNNTNSPSLTKEELEYNRIRLNKIEKDMNNIFIEKKYSKTPNVISKEQNCLSLTRKEVEEKICKLLNLERLINEYRKKCHLPPIISQLTDTERLINTSHLSNFMLDTHILFVQKQIKEKDTQQIINKVQELNTLKHEYSQKCKSGNYITEDIHSAYLSTISQKENEILELTHLNNMILK